MDILRWLYEASIPIGGYELHWLELIGVLFGLASAVGGLVRRVWAWPVGIVGNVLLFFVYITVTFDAADGRAPLFGQSGRQIFFIITSVYGWWRWNQVKKAADRPADAPAIVPRWATARERVTLLVTMVVGVLVVQQVFAVIGAGWPAPRWYFWCDAWIFVGSMLATYAMARGWNEFWLVWIAVDLVGVPLLVHSGYLPTAVLYGVYSVFVLYGFVAWVRASRTERPTPEIEDAGVARQPARG
ncbi:nicotinamide riboside transporter PnuC [Terracoccus luteus]|jgi:nicotinamide mononucleotide transporter|uniref:Nicotinamide mononucleotide transporter n=1 Tax=Terracoccus luteus TaxID=53356 RepID=A0A495Y2E4_9MICO|nr:nicotinamide riboside transporter PnuC [Terracoccus luteus]MBB2987813.1 nicotinamide mononucleotide transporter [Terracoccus luteus]MCP2173464.1 nicotinamide mononucleotide transporter [Terracoccus luteus]RKT78198.1 nicotinamide mononucleotide transporter [Terracoccus luteus]